ncbi:UNVERIFIED_CONTAM: hypothetical protein Slati_2736000 [Sesamum latifolium]|uniref:Retrotransposon Copia-like N-terminal domain-containing protein n=1 Tax=Sesamum latifolium TaxID=2727402 RepID=A0AAW2VX91_9LAMI
MAQDPEILKVQPSDNPGMSLVSAPLDGTNFLAWSRSIKIALGAKMKLSFINGRGEKPKETDENYEQWILMLEPLPTVSEAYSMILRVEKEREVHLGSSNTGQNMAMQAKGSNFRKRNLVEQRRQDGASTSRTFNVATSEDHAQNTVDELDLSEMIRNEIQRDMGDTHSAASGSEDYHEFSGPQD